MSQQQWHAFILEYHYQPYTAMSEIVGHVGGELKLRKASAGTDGQFQPHIYMSRN